MTSLAPALSLGERAPIYDFAARLLASEIDATTWEALGREPLRSMLDKAHPGFATWVGVDFDEALREALSEEFARLFLVPGVVPPFATRWLVATIGDEETRETTRGEIASLIALACEGLGLDPRDAGPGGRLPPDHAALIFAIAAEAARQPGAENDELLARFDEALLGPGWSAMGDALVEHAQAPIYSALGVLLGELSREG